MASNLSSIGFHFTSEDDFDTTMSALASSAQDRVSCQAGDYVIWHAPSGAEIWFHLPVFGNEDVSADLAGLTPFFSGDSTVELKITARLKRPDDNDFEGALTAWVAPDEETGEGSYPIVLDAVDFSAHGSRTLPIRCRAQITGFARQLRVFASEAEFAAAQNESQSNPPLARQAFIPLGLFASSMGDDVGTTKGAKAPSSAALLTGKVLKHAKLANGNEQPSYHWLVVESLDATYDVVADPDVVEGEPVEGAIVEVGCVLFGRLLD
jgi:hypothetical protein